MIQFNKILSASQTKAADQYTIKNEPIKSIDLMERASLAFVNTIESELSKNSTIHVFCGCGNNGGDGMAIGRMLLERGYNIKVYLVKFSKPLSADCQINFERISKKLEVSIIKANGFELYKNKSDIIIDAVFGSGLNKIVDNKICSNVFKVINNSNLKVIAVDIPSGLFCDEPTPSKNIVKADITVSFQRPKLAFFMPGYGDYVNNWLVADIGLDETYINSQPSNYFYLDEKVLSLIKVRKKFSHKGNYGHALLIAGSYGKMGAAVLASQACLKHGVGLLTCHVPKCGYEIIQISSPRAMCTVDINESHVSKLEDMQTYDTIAVGPGIGTHNETYQLLKSIINYKNPMVIDADALNIISEEPTLLSKIPKNSILTPHPKEFERLFGKTENSFEQLNLGIKKAVEYQIIIILKGAHTAVINTDGKVFFNTTGSPKLAQGGSGDILTGIITSYLSQGYSPLESSIISVYLHGLN